MLVVVALSRTDKQREESVADSAAACGLSDREQAALVALMASFNSSCAYNVSVNGYTLP